VCWHTEKATDVRLLDLVITHQSQGASMPKVPSPVVGGPHALGVDIRRSQQCRPVQALAAGSPQSQK
jgi:hypothetical protein